MGSVSKAILATCGLGIACAAFLACATLAMPLFGAFSGWVLSLVMPGLMEAGFRALGLNVQADHLAGLGAVCGFITAFLRPVRPSGDKS